MDGTTGVLRRTDPLAERSRPWWVLLLMMGAGVLLTIIASALYNGWDSALPESTVDEFNSKIAVDGNGARYLVFTDLFGFIPGYILVIGGLNLLIRRLRGLPRWFFRSSGIVLAALVAAAMLNIVADAVLLFLFGVGDLGTGTFEVAPGGYSLWTSIMSIFNAFLVVSILGTVIHGLTGLVLAAVSRVRRT